MNALGIRRVREAERFIGVMPIDELETFVAERSWLNLRAITPTSLVNILEEEREDNARKEKEAENDQLNLGDARLQSAYNTLHANLRKTMDRYDELWAEHRRLQSGAKALIIEVGQLRSLVHQTEKQSNIVMSRVRGLSGLMTPIFNEAISNKEEHHG
jgi:uncharacterized protein (DUF3084 family)